MQVRCGEGLAIRIGPEPCAGLREGVGEASAGEHIGQPLSLENDTQSGVPTLCSGRKATRRARHRKRVSAPRGPRPWHVWKFFAREPGEIMTDQRCVGPHREGAHSEADDARS